MIGIAVRSLLFFALLFTVHCSLLTAICFAEESIVITADILEYESKTFTYTAKGQVKIQKGPVTIDADEIKFNEKTSDVIAEGIVIYEDPLLRIKAKRAELNLETKTGRLYEAEIFSKRDNYHIKGLEVEKKAEGRYFLKEALFTTCDAPTPEWCFKGKDVDIMVGDKLISRSVSFNLKEIPVLYSPYLQAPLSSERKTGLLIPAVSYIESKGLRYEQPFFWAISENRDATFLLDIYGKRGIGEGLEYRYMEKDGSAGNFWLYHLKDEKLGRDFWKLHGVHEDRNPDAKITGYLNLNYINSRDFYTEYNPYIITKGIDPVSYLNVTTGRFLESTGEAALKLDNSRLYLRSRYIVDLKYGVDDSTIPQRLPEIGYFINPQRLGPVVISLESDISNFWREGGASGQRIDIYPRITHSFGSDVIIKQSIGLRETAYSLDNADEYGSSPHRESFDYNISANARLAKKYNTLVHIIEPTLRYIFIPSTNLNLPLFDSTELYSKTSRFELSLQNRFLDSNGEFLTMKITQAFDSFSDENHFLPLKLDIAVKRPVSLRAELTYDFNKGRVDGINSDLGISLYKAFFSLGERYNRTEDILFYTIGASYSYSKTISAEGIFWYDAKNGGLNDFTAKLKYQKQCWGSAVVLTKLQNDYSVTVLFNLLGLGEIKI